MQPSPSSLSSILRLRPLVTISANFHRLSPSSTVRAFSTRRKSSSVDDPNPNTSDGPPKEETILLEGLDFEHWLVIVETPEGDPTRDEIIDSYIKTLAQVVGSEDEARMKIYSVSTRHYFAFGALVSEELVHKLKELTNVRWVLPDSYLDVKNKDYGGEPFINGQAVPYDPKYHEEWLRNRGIAKERNKCKDRPHGGPAGLPPGNMGGQPQPNMGGQSNMGGGMLQNNVGGVPPQYNPGGGQPPCNPGGGQPQYNQGGGMPQHHIGGDPQYNAERMPQNNMAGPPNNMGGGMPQDNMGGGVRNTAPPNFQYGPNNGRGANMGGGMLQNNMGGVPPQYNPGGGQTPYNPGGGQPQYNQGGGMLQNNIGGNPQYNTGWMPQNNMAGPPNNMGGGMPQNNMGGGVWNTAPPNFQYGPNYGMGANMGGGMLQNNMGGVPPQYNPGGGQPPCSPGGGQPQYNQGGGMPQNNIVGNPQYNTGWMPQNNMAGPPNNMGGGMPQNNMGGGVQNTAPPNFQYGPNNGGMPYQNREMSGPGHNREYEHNTFAPNLGARNPHQTQDMPGRDMPPPPTPNDQ